MRGRWRSGILAILLLASAALNLKFYQQAVSDYRDLNAVRLRFARLQSEVGIAPQDVEMTIFETPRQNWGIRGQPGDELALNYRVDL